MISDVPLWLLGQAKYTSDWVCPTQPYAHFLIQEVTVFKKYCSNRKNYKLRKNMVMQKEEVKIRVMIG